MNQEFIEKLKFVQIPTKTYVDDEKGMRWYLNKGKPKYGKLFYRCSVVGCRAKCFHKFDEPNTMCLIKEHDMEKHEKTPFSQRKCATPRMYARRKIFNINKVSKGSDNNLVAFMENMKKEGVYKRKKLDKDTMAIINTKAHTTPPIPLSDITNTLPSKPPQIPSPPKIPKIPKPPISPPSSTLPTSLPPKAPSSLPLPSPPPSLPLPFPPKIPKEGTPISLQNQELVLKILQILTDMPEQKLALLQACVRQKLLYFKVEQVLSLFEPECEEFPPRKKRGRPKGARNKKKYSMYPPGYGVETKEKEVADGGDCLEAFGMSLGGNVGGETGEDLVSDLNDLCKSLHS